MRRESIMIRKICVTDYLLVFFLSMLMIRTAVSGELMTKVMYNDIDAVKQLLSSGANVNEQDETYGSTPLLMACSYEDYTEMVKLLLEHGADPNIQDKVYGSTALIAAAGISKEVVDHFCICHDGGHRSPFCGHRVSSFPPAGAGLPPCAAPARAAAPGARPR